MKKILLPFVILGPVLVFASDLTIKGAIAKFVQVIIQPIIVLCFAAALLYFFYGLFKMMLDLSEGGDASEGKQHMLWGIIGLFIMFSVWGIMNIITSTMGAPNVDQSAISPGGGFR